MTLRAGYLKTESMAFASEVEPEIESCTAFVFGSSRLHMMDTKRIMKEEPSREDNSVSSSSSNKSSARGSKYKGVNLHRRGKRWESHIWYGKKQLHIGCFKSEVAAAIAFDIMALKLKGKATQLNFHSECYQLEQVFMSDMTNDEVHMAVREMARGKIPSRQTRIEEVEVEIVEEAQESGQCLQRQTSSNSSESPPFNSVEPSNMLCLPSALPRLLHPHPPPPPTRCSDRCDALEPAGSAHVSIKEAAVQGSENQMETPDSADVRTPVSPGTPLRVTQIPSQCSTTGAMQFSVSSSESADPSDQANLPRTDSALPVQSNPHLPASVQLRPPHAAPTTVGVPALPESAPAPGAPPPTTTANQPNCQSSAPQMPPEEADILPTVCTQTTQQPNQPKPATSLQSQPQQLRTASPTLSSGAPETSAPTAAGTGMLVVARKARRTGAISIIKRAASQRSSVTGHTREPLSQAPPQYPPDIEMPDSPFATHVHVQHSRRHNTINVNASGRDHTTIQERVPHGELLRKTSVTSAPQTRDAASHQAVVKRLMAKLWQAAALETNALAEHSHSTPSLEHCDHEDQVIDQVDSVGYNGFVDHVVDHIDHVDCYCPPARSAAHSPDPSFPPSYQLHPCAPPHTTTCSRYPAGRDPANPVDNMELGESVDQIFDKGGMAMRFVSPVQVGQASPRRLPASSPQHCPIPDTQLETQHDAARQPPPVTLGTASNQITRDHHSFCHATDGDNPQSLPISGILPLYPLSPSNQLSHPSSSGAVPTPPSTPIHSTTLQNTPFPHSPMDPPVPAPPASMPSPEALDADMQDSSDMYAESEIHDIFTDLLILPLEIEQQPQALQDDNLPGIPPTTTQDHSLFTPFGCKSGASVATNSHCTMAMIPRGVPCTYSSSDCADAVIATECSTAPVHDALLPTSSCESSISLLLSAETGQVRNSNIHSKLAHGQLGSCGLQGQLHNEANNNIHGVPAVLAHTILSQVDDSTAPMVDDTLFQHALGQLLIGATTGGPPHIPSVERPRQAIKTRLGQVLQRIQSLGVHTQQQHKADLHPASMNFQALQHQFKQQRLKRMQQKLEQQQQPAPQSVQAIQPKLQEQQYMNKVHAMKEEQNQPTAARKATFLSHKEFTALCQKYKDPPSKKRNHSGMVGMVKPEPELFSTGETEPARKHSRTLPLEQHARTAYGALLQC